MLDFEQLAFIEKWRQKASRGVVIALDGTRGDIVAKVRGGLVAPGAAVSGTVSATGDVAVVDCGAAVLVRGETLGSMGVGDAVEFTVDGEGKAYLIPTRG